MENWVIVGCGYTGGHLARFLVGEGHSVRITRRTEREAMTTARELGCEGLCFDLRDTKATRALDLAQAIVVNSAPPAEDGGDGERLLSQLAATHGARRLVYLSSTGVYAAAGSGESVDENFAVAPTSTHGRRRLAAERATLDAWQGGAVALRIAGIYGPGRGAIERMRAGTYRIVGAGDTFVSRVHVADLVTAIVAVGRARKLDHRVYNVADDDPACAREFVDTVMKRLGLPRPPEVALSDVSEMARAMLTANRRVDNTRLKNELGVSLRYPSFRDALTAS